jgi:hypothetical protein
MTTTTRQAVVDGKQVFEAETTDFTRIEEMLDSTADGLTLFPSLITVPNIRIYCMNIWQMESHFDVWPLGSNSRHSTIVSGTGNSATSSGPWGEYESLGSQYVPDAVSQWHSGTAFFTDYWDDPIIKEEKRKFGDTPALIDGLYAHGVSAAMGAYHVKGTRAYSSMFGLPKYQGLAQSEGLVVNPNQSITALYVDTKAGRRKSIIAGLIILDQHYCTWLGKPITPQIAKKILACGGGDNGQPPTNYSVNSEQAILLACGSYLGFGAPDANGALGYNRAHAVVYTSPKWEYRARASTSGSTAGASPANPVGCT